MLQLREPIPAGGFTATLMFCTHIIIVCCPVAAAAASSASASTGSAGTITIAAQVVKVLGMLYYCYCSRCCHGCCHCCRYCCRCMHGDAAAAVVPSNATCCRCRHFYFCGCCTQLKEVCWLALRV